jgi:hypothetical protein
MRQESTTKPTEQKMRRLAGEEGVKGASITRIDRKVRYEIDFRDKRYAEIPLESLKNSGKETPGAGTAERSQRRLTCDPVRVESKRTGGKVDVNGFPSEETVIVGTQVCRSEMPRQLQPAPETEPTQETPQTQQPQQTCKNVFTLESWATPVTSRLRELQAFDRKLAAATGLGLAQTLAVARVPQGAMSHLGQGFEAVYSEMAKAEGYSVRSRVTVESEGSCDSMGRGGAGARAGMGGGSSATGGRFKGSFGRKGSEGGRSQLQQMVAAASPGPTKIFGMATEVVSVSASPAPADAFEPPEGFVKKAPPSREPAQGAAPQPKTLAQPQPKK